LRGAFDELSKSDRASAILAIVGIVNVPIIHFSVDWWSTLHQPASLSRLASPSISPNMLWPLLAMILAFTLFFLAMLTMRVRGEVLDRERHSRWVAELQPTAGRN
jgi:heme exporter protein C